MQNTTLCGIAAVLVMQTVLTVSEQIKSDIVKKGSDVYYCYNRTL